MPKRTPRRRRASVSGASPERAPEPEAEPESEFGTPTASADVGAELAEVRANQAATATALETLLTQVADLTSGSLMPGGICGESLLHAHRLSRPNGWLVRRVEQLPTIGSLPQRWRVL